MKKILLLAVIMMATAAYGATPDNKKKKKKDKTEVKAEPLKLVTPSDSISYAAGMASTRGLLSYIQQEYNVDTTYIQDFIQGYKDAIASAGDPKFTARNAGMQIARLVGQRMLPSATKQFEGTKYAINKDIYNTAFIAGVLGDTTLMDVKSAAQLFTEVSEAENQRKEQAYKSENEQWLTANAAKEGVKTTASGLQYKVIKEGTGETPKATDRVKVRYEGKLIDGTEFDSSYKRGAEPTAFRADEVIKGWTEALTMMPVGSKWELYIPQNLGYGARQAGKIKPYSTLVFTVELVEIDKPEPAQDSLKNTGDSSKNASMLMLKKVSVSAVGAAKAPAAAGSLEVTAGADDAMTATVSFDAPDRNLEEQPVSPLTRISIYRNKEAEPAHVFESPSAGAHLTWTDGSVKSVGMNTYTVVPENEYGAGESAADSAFVGVYTAPYKETFDSRGAADLYTSTLDGIDLETNPFYGWEYDSMNKRMKFSAYVTDTPVEAWLYTPMIRLDADAVYELSLGVMTSVYSETVTNKVYMGTSAEPQTQSVHVGDLPKSTAYQMKDVAYNVVTGEGGKYCFGIIEG